MNAVWELERQYQPEIMHRFHIQFRTDTTSIENCLCQLVQMQGKAYMAKYNPKLEVRMRTVSCMDCLKSGTGRVRKACIGQCSLYCIQKMWYPARCFEETGAFQNISHLIALKCSWHWGIMQQRLRNLC